MRYLGADDDRHRPFRHDLLQERQAVHAWHDKIGDDHIRRFFFNLGKGNDGIGGHADFDFRVSTEHGLHYLPHDRGVVYDEDMNASVGFSSCAREVRLHNSPRFRLE